MCVHDILGFNPQLLQKGFDLVVNSLPNKIVVLVLVIIQGS
jgi:hypothetical protein